MYCSTISRSDGGFGLGNRSRLTNLALHFPPFRGLFRTQGVLNAFARRTTKHLKITSATVGNGIEIKLKGSKFRLEKWHTGQVTVFRTCPIATSAIMDRFLLKNLKTKTKLAGFVQARDKPNLVNLPPPGFLAYSGKIGFLHPVIFEALQYLEWFYNQRQRIILMT